MRTGERHASVSQLCQFIRENNTHALIASIEAGVEGPVIAHLPRALGATRTEVADLLGVSAKSFQRLIRTGLQGTGTRHVGERAIRLLQVLEKAIDVLEHEDQALAWFHEPNAAFAQRSPFVHAKTELGCRQIENELARIEHGVFS